MGCKVWRCYLLTIEGGTPLFLCWLAEFYGACTVGKCAVAFCVGIISMDGIYSRIRLNLRYLVGGISPHCQPF